MPIRKIARLGEPVLRRKARPLLPEEIGTPYVNALVDDMIETMRDADGAGLAAPQVYESVQIVVIELQSNPRYPDLDHVPMTVLINPLVTPMVDPYDGVPASRDTISVYEGCLSVPELRGRVARPRRVRVEALDVVGERIDAIWEGFPAVVVQHETDHLKGILYVDRADPTTLAFMREFERHVPPESRIVDGKLVSE